MAQPNVPIIGQPFTLSDLSLPVNCVVACNCTIPAVPLAVIASAFVTCPGCRKTYRVTFNPQNGQVEVAMALPEPEKVLS